MNNTPTEITATSQKAALEEFRSREQAIEKEIDRLRQELESECQSFADRMRSSGWRKFEFHSSYYGSHSELGEGDHENVFFFHPSVDISRWDGVMFSHGHNGQNENNDRFDEWLADLPEDCYIEL